jgi:hypothetical protein
MKKIHLIGTRTRDLPACSIVPLNVFSSYLCYLFHIVLLFLTSFRSTECNMCVCIYIYVYGSRDRAVGIATSYGLDDRGVGVRVPVESRIFSSPRRPDWHWSPSSLLSNGYPGLFPPRWSVRGEKLTTHLQLVPRSRQCESIHPLPIHLRGVVIN